MHYIQCHALKVYQPWHNRHLGLGNPLASEVAVLRAIGHLSIHSPYALDGKIMCPTSCDNQLSPNIATWGMGDKVTLYHIFLLYESKCSSWYKLLSLVPKTQGEVPSFHGISKLYPLETGHLSYL